eukprot:16440256-Heterocapsa_arctica.AAC.1
MFIRIRASSLSPSNSSQENQALEYASGKLKGAREVATEAGKQQAVEPELAYGPLKGDREGVTAD